MFHKTVCLFCGFVILILGSFALPSCVNHSKEREQLRLQDSARAVEDRKLKAHLAELSKVDMQVYGPSSAGTGLVQRAELYKAFETDSSIKRAIHVFMVLQARLDKAEKDSTTRYGRLLTRFKLLNAQKKYLVGTYGDQAELLRYSSKTTIDDKHEVNIDFYFYKDSLAFFREKKTATEDEQDLMTDDSYFLFGGKVVLAYRDEGSARVQRDKMNVMSIKRYRLIGDLTGHVSNEFSIFRADYDSLKLQTLEALIYP